MSDYTGGYALISDYRILPLVSFMSDYTVGYALISDYRILPLVSFMSDYTVVYRTSGVIFFIDYCTAIRDT